MEYEAFIEVRMKFVAFWIMTLCSFEGGYKYFAASIFNPEEGCSKFIYLEFI
jgi:hypothetical protein